jgi:hypothetical protein
LGEAKKYQSVLNSGFSKESFMEKKRIMEGNVNESEQKLLDSDDVTSHETSLSEMVGQRVTAVGRRYSFHRRMEGKYSSSLETVGAINAEKKKQIQEAHDKLLTLVNTHDGSAKMNSSLFNNFTDPDSIKDLINKTRETDMRAITNGLKDSATDDDKVAARYALNKAIDEADLGKDQTEWLKDGLSISDLKDSAKRQKEQALEDILGKDYIQEKNYASSKEARLTINKAFENKRLQIESANTMKNPEQRDKLIAKANSDYEEVIKDVNSYKTMERGWEAAVQKNIEDLESRKGGQDVSDGQIDVLIQKERDRAESIHEINDTLAHIRDYRDFVTSNDDVPYSQIKKAFKSQKDRGYSRAADALDVKNQADSNRFRRTDIGSVARAANDVHPIRKAKKMASKMSGSHHTSRLDKPSKDEGDKQ